MSQVLRVVFLCLFGAITTSVMASDIDLVKVDKSKRRLYLMANYEVIKEYRIALGDNPKGHKRVAGDKRTPEGFYRIIAKNDQSNFYRSIRINYPNEVDASNAALFGQDPGGDIMIHGLKNGETQSPSFIQSFDWTDGCIALTNREMDEIFRLVKVGTPIHIEW